MKKVIINILVISMILTYINPTSIIYANGIIDSEIINQTNEVQEVMENENVIEVYQTPANVIVTPDEDSLLFKENLDKQIYTSSTSFSVSSGYSVETGFEYFVTLVVGFNASTSYTVAAKESYSRDIPAGYKGCIIMRYSQDKVSFTQVKRYLSTIVSSNSGYVWSAPYETYYSVSLIAL